MSTPSSSGLELLRAIRARTSSSRTDETDKSLEQGKPHIASASTTAGPPAITAFDGTRGTAKTDKSQGEDVGPDCDAGHDHAEMHEGDTAKTDESQSRELLSVLAVPGGASPPESGDNRGAKHVEGPERYWRKVKAIKEIHELPARFNALMKAAGYPRAAILTVINSRVLVADVYDAMVHDRMLVLGTVSEDDVSGSLEDAIRALPAAPTQAEVALSEKRPPNPDQSRCELCGTRMSVVRLGDTCGYCMKLRPPS